MKLISNFKESRKVFPFYKINLLALRGHVLHLHIRIASLDKIDLYLTAAILTLRRTKSFVFDRPASHWMWGYTKKYFVSVLPDKGLLTPFLT